MSCIKKILMSMLCVILIGLAGIVILNEKESEGCYHGITGGDTTSGGDDPPACNSNIIVCQGNDSCGDGGFTSGWACCSEVDASRRCWEYDAVYDSQTQTCVKGDLLETYINGTRKTLNLSGSCGTA